MKNYLMMYCIYNPERYFGHRIKHIEAESIEDAERKGYEYLETLAGKGQWEYIIAENPSSYRIYNNKEHKRM